MYKLSNIVEKAKADVTNNKVGLFTIYRLRNKKILKWDNSDVFLENGDYLHTLVQFEKGSNGWEMKRISEEGNTKIFNEALEDGWRLSYDVFSPELDNLKEKSLGSVLFKVLHEMDLLDEGEDCMETNPRTARSWRKKASAYFRKYRDFLNGEEASEKETMYKNF